MMMEQFQKQELERMNMATKQNKNPWEVEFDANEATGGASAKSFSY